MKKLLFVAISALSTSALAWEPEFYAGAGFSSWQFKRHSVPADLTSNSIEAVGGVTLIENLGVEARFGGGLDSDAESIFVPGIPAVIDDMGTADTTDDVEISAEIPSRIYTTDFKMNYYASIYLKPKLENETASLYGLLGYTTVDYDNASDGVVFDDSDGGVSVGVGVSFTYNERVDFNFEWKKLINADDFDIRGATAGFKYSF